LFWTHAQKRGKTAKFELCFSNKEDRRRVEKQGQRRGRRENTKGQQRRL